MTAPATEPLGVLTYAQDSFGVAPNSPVNEWPFNVLSQKAVRFAGGRVGRLSGPVPVAADPAEQALCDTVSQQAAAMVKKIPVCPKQAEIEPFRLPAAAGEPVATEITPDLIRDRFGGTLHPWAKVEITPLADASSYDLSQKFFDVFPPTHTAHNQAWSTVRNWFKRNAHLTGTGWMVEAAVPGVSGSQAVRLAVGLTKAGSVVGFAAVGLMSSLTRSMGPDELYPHLREFELDEFKQWLDGGSGRAVARVILRTFPDERMEDWANEAHATAKKLKSKFRPAFWRSEFHKLTPERAVELPPAWEVVQRCVTGGRWDGHWQGEPRPYFDLWARFGEFERGADGFFWLDAERVRRNADWFAAHDEEWLKAKYADLRATDYAPFMSEADWTAAAEVYRQTAEFYRQAAAGGCAVVSEITARTDEQIAAETAAPLPAARPTPPGACPVDDALLAPLLECMNTYGVEEEGEWPHNDLSPKIVRFACGRVAREGEVIEHRHPEDEVDRCREVSAEAERRLSWCRPAHDQGGPYRAFFAAANSGDAVPLQFTEAFVREELFRGTINPEVAVSVGPLTAAEVWYGGDPRADEFVRWFTAQPGLHGWAFVSIGLSEDVGGACHPRLAVALTDKGSVVGVCGYVVWA